MKVLVAGGAGMLGSHLVDALVARGHRVIVLDNFVTGAAKNLARLANDVRLQLIDADITRPLDEIARGIGSVDRIYHLASPASPVAYARDPIATLMVNADGTRRLLDLALATDARFVLASTSEVYGDPEISPQPESYWGNVNPIGPRACYDEGKRFAEALTVTYGRMHGVDVRIARIFNTYGPRSAVDDGRVIPNFCVQALRGEPITIYGDGRQTRSFCYVDDLVRGLMLLGEQPGLAGEVVNLGNPVEQTIAEIARTIVALAGSDSRVEFLPLPTDDPVQRCPDIGKAERLLGWRPEVAFADGVARTLTWLRAELTSDTLDMGEPGPE